MFHDKSVSARSGFTLIELLVVIAIIVILSVILLPVFASVREKVRQSACLSNERQIGMAMEQYTQDYDDYLPCGTVGAVPNMGMGWAGQILPYVKGARVFVCPDELGRPNVAAPSGAAYYSYCYNIGLVRDQEGLSYDTFSYMMPINAYTETSRTVLVYETSSYAYALVPGETSSPISNAQGQGMNSYPYPNGADNFPRASWVGSLNPVPTSRHSTGSNFLEADGHAKWLKPEEISYGYANDLGNHTYSTNTASYFVANSNTLFAEATEYEGPDKHALTMSYR